MAQSLLGRRILLLTAHPDDEAFLSAGLAWQNFRHGGTTAIICATLGEKGMSHLPHPVTRTKLKAIRKRELMNCAKLVHLNPVNILHLPDGGVMDHEVAFTKRTKALIRQLKPEVLITFGPDGLTGHRDHISCWRVGRKLARAAGLPLFVFTVSPKIRTKAAGWFMARRVNPHYQPRIAPYAKATVRIPMPPGLKIKIIRQHPSQMDGRNPYRGFPKSAVQEFTRAEYFAKR